MSLEKSYLDGEWYRCKMCNHKLARRVQGHICVTESAESNKPQLEIKCKHKSNGVFCDTINVIEL